MPYPTLVEIGSQPGACIRFWCEPCRRLRTFDPSDLAALFGPEFIAANLERHLICGGCQMPADGENRTLTVYPGAG